MSRYNFLETESKLRGIQQHFTGGSRRLAGQREAIRCRTAAAADDVGGHSQVQFIDLVDHILQRVVGIDRQLRRRRPVDHLRGCSLDVDLGGRSQQFQVRGRGSGSGFHDLQGSPAVGRVDQQDAVARVVDAGLHRQSQAVDQLEDVADRFGVRGPQIHTARRARGVGDEEGTEFDASAVVERLETHGSREIPADAAIRCPHSAGPR